MKGHNTSPQGDGNLQKSTVFVGIVVTQYIPTRGQIRLCVSFAPYLDRHNTSPQGDENLRPIATTITPTGRNTSPRGDGNLRYPVVIAISLAIQHILARGRAFVPVDAMVKQSETPHISAMGRKATLKHMVYNLNEVAVPREGTDTLKRDKTVRFPCGRNTPPPGDGNVS